MNTLLILIPISLAFGLIALIAFLWAQRAGQFDDLDGAASRILFDDDDPTPSPPADGANRRPDEEA